MKENKIKGFTLIELLVVVLIIGILSAVALPKYEKAILKSRFVQMQTAIRAIYDAQTVYQLANGEYATQFSDLSLDFGTIDENNPKIIRKGKIWCNLDDAEQRFICHFSYTQLIVQNWYKPRRQQCCVYKDDNFKGENLCQELKNTTTWRDRCGGQGACHCY